MSGPGDRARAMATLALLLMAALAAGAQGSKRLATPAGGQPWDGCADLEGYVADTSGAFTVQSARCDGVIRAWLLKRGVDASEQAVVIDQISVRPLRPGETFSAGPYCTVRKAELRWLAIYEWRQRKRIAAGAPGIVEAWTANVRAGRLEPAPRSLVRAANCTASDDE